MPTGLVYFMCALCDTADMVIGDIAGKRNKTVGSCCGLRVSIFLGLGMGMENMRPVFLFKPFGWPFYGSVKGPIG